MSPQIIYKGSVGKDFRKFPGNKNKRQDLKARIESNLCKARYNGNKLKGEYKGVWSLDIHHKVLVAYNVFRETILVLALSENYTKGE